MPARKVAGKLRPVAAAQTVAEGRPSRAKDARPLAFRRLDGEEGAIAGLVFAMSDPALFGPDGPKKSEAQKHVRYCRGRVRATVGDEKQARELFALASVQASDLRQLRDAHPSAQSHLVEQRAGAVATMREFHVQAWTGRTGVAVAARMQALGLSLLDAGAKTLDVDALKAARELLAAARLHRADALDTDRRAKLTAPPPAFAWTMPAAPPAPPEPAQDGADGADDADDALDDETSPEPAQDVLDEDDEHTPGLDHDERDDDAPNPGVRSRDPRPDEPETILVGRTAAASTVGSGTWDPRTGKPHVAAPGPDANARRDQAKRGLRWDDVARRWLPIDPLDIRTGQRT